MEPLFLPFLLRNGTKRKDPQTRLPQKILVGNYHTNYSYSQTFPDIYAPRTKTIEGIYVKLQEHKYIQVISNLYYECILT
jgi:hypothetical protein